MLPDAKEEDIVKVEQALVKMPQMSTMIAENESLEVILHTYFDDVKILTTQDICFKCHCDRAAMKRALSTLSKEEREAMIAEDHGCEITCNFCNEHYTFSEQELIDLGDFLDKYGK